MPFTKSNNVHFDFSIALQFIKSGQKLARAGWNGLGMFAYLVPAAKYKACTAAGASCANENGQVQYNSYFAIKNVNNTVSTWVPSVNDCLADDWYIVE